MRFNKGDRVIDTRARTGGTVLKDSDGPEVLVAPDQGAAHPFKAENLEPGLAWPTDPVLAPDPPGGEG